MPTHLSRIKFREAAFFLAGMRAREGSDRLDLGEEFGYFLSAFLSAARSVSFVLRKENPGRYAALRDSWLKSLAPATRILCNAMVEHRNVALKQGRLPTRQDIRYVPWLAVAGRRAQSIRLIMPSAYDQQATIGTLAFRLDLPSGPEPAVEVCELYLGDLERLIVQFETKG